MQRQPKSLKESFDELNEVSTEKYLQEDAKRRGIEWHVYCRKFGIMGSAAKKRIKRHETVYSPLAADLNPKETE